jgi:hypothetical protein
MKTRLMTLSLIIFLAALPAFAGKYLLYVTIHILLLSIFSLAFALVTLLKGTAFLHDIVYSCL